MKKDVVEAVMRDTFMSHSVAGAVGQSPSALGASVGDTTVPTESTTIACKTEASISLERQRNWEISPRDIATSGDLERLVSAPPTINVEQPAQVASVSRTPLRAAAEINESMIVHVEMQKPGVGRCFRAKSWDPATKQKVNAVPSARAGDAGTTCALGFDHTFLARQLSELDVALAGEVVRYADRLRTKRVLKRVESNRSTAMRDAIRIVASCRGREPCGSVEAEALVRLRTGRCYEHPLHVYGFLLHVCMYPLTVLLAIAGYLRMALMASARIMAKPGRRESSSSVTDLLCVAQAVLVSLCTLLMVAPFAALLVIFCVLPDITLLILRPCLPTPTKRTSLPWFFPTSLAFWCAGACGCWTAVLAYHLLGAFPVAGAFVNTNLGGELCVTYSDSHPPSQAFQAAVICDPDFLADRRHLRAAALKGVCEFYAPAGGRLAMMPVIVQWAYLLGDVKLCAAWEAEAMGLLPQVSPEARRA